MPVELHVLRSDRMSLVPGPDGWPMAYEYHVGVAQAPLRAWARGRRPSVTSRAFHPQNDHYGLSAFQAAAMAIEVHNSASRWSRALLENAARPSGAIIYSGSDGQGTLSHEQYERLLEELQTQHQGAVNAGRPMLLEGGLDWKPMGFSPSDMEFQQTKEAAAREIALAFGVPPMLLGIPGDATYANYREANRAFWRLTVLPLAQRVVGSVSHWLGGHAARRSSSAGPRPGAGALRRAGRAVAARGRRGLPTTAEKRALLGLPRLAEDDDRNTNERDDEE